MKNLLKFIKKNEKKETDGEAKPQSKETRRKRIRLFYKTLLISLSIFSSLALSGWLAVRSLMQPPVIPEQVMASTHDMDDAVTAVATAPPEDDAEPPAEEEDEPPEPIDENARKENFYTFLIIGTDNGVNTDTIMIASYDAEKTKANLISIPRDTYVEADRSVKKINAAYATGTLRGGGVEGGVAKLREELNAIIGFVPDFYVCINLRAFRRIVDAVGGISVYVPMRMVYDDPEQDLHINLSPGMQRLNGDNALKFSRYRMGNDQSMTITDYKRIENQQAVIRAVLAELLKPASILKIPEFIDIFIENVKTDIQMENILWFADQFLKVKDDGNLDTYTMPTTGTSSLPFYYEYLDEAEVVKLINDTVNPFIRDIKAEDLDIKGE